MAKAVLKFDLSDPDDRDSFKRASKSDSYALALFQIRNEVFRPARKHGYSNPKIQEYLDKNPKACDLVYELEKMFGEILDEYGVSSDD